MCVFILTSETSENRIARRARLTDEPFSAVSQFVNFVAFGTKWKVAHRCMRVQTQMKQIKSAHNDDEDDVMMMMMMMTMMTLNAL